MLRTIARIPGFILFVLFLVACGAQDTPTAPPVNTPPPTSTSQPTRTPLSTVTATSEPTLTPTMPFTPSPTPWPMGSLGPIAYVFSNVYTGNDEINLVSPSAFEFQTIYTNSTSSSELAHSLSWSPDAQSIAFIKRFSDPSSYSDIFILNVVDSKARNITNTTDVSELDLAWSPDGTRIAFAGSTRVDGTNYRRNIYVMNADGSNIQKVNDCPSDCEQPTWSPAGESIAYVSDSQVFVMNSDGSNARQITRGALNSGPAWSPDGQHIAFFRRISFDREGYLYLMRPDGSNLTALTDSTNSAWGEQLAWSPDGRFIAFQNNPKNNASGIYIVDVQSGMTRLAVGMHAYAPAWNPVLIPTINPEDIKALPDCTAGWTRLVAGGQGRVMGAPGGPSNRVRSEPLKGDNIIDELPADSVFHVLEGPVCADGLVFWKVRNIGIPGGSGWTAEGGGLEYWLEPYTP